VSTGGDRGGRGRTVWRAARALPPRGWPGLVFGGLEESWKRKHPRASRRRLSVDYAWAVIAMLLVPIIGLRPDGVYGIHVFSPFRLPKPERSLVRAVSRRSPLWLGAMIRSFGIGFATAADHGFHRIDGGFSGVARTRSRLGAATFLLCLFPR